MFGKDAVKPQKPTPVAKAPEPVRNVYESSVPPDLKAFLAGSGEKTPVRDERRPEIGQPVREKLGVDPLMSGEPSELAKPKRLAKPDNGSKYFYEIPGLFDEDDPGKKKGSRR